MILRIFQRIIRKRINIYLQVITKPPSLLPTTIIYQLHRKVLYCLESLQLLLKIFHLFLLARQIFIRLNRRANTVLLIEFLAWTYIIINIWLTKYASPCFVVIVLFLGWDWLSDWLGNYYDYAVFWDVGNQVEKYYCYVSWLFFYCYIIPSIYSSSK